MTTPLSMTIMHELPGGVRLKFSQHLHAPDAFGDTLRSHVGVGRPTYNPIGATMLVRYAPKTIARAELLVRAALAFSLEHDAQPVRINFASDHQDLTPSVALSGILLGILGLGRLLGFDPAGLKDFELIAGLCTGGAVMSHAAQEIRETGNYHPEVASIAYLAVGMLRQNTWPAAVLTWFASFGRHFLEDQYQAIEVRAEPGGTDAQVVAAPAPTSGWQAWMRLVPTLVRQLVGTKSPPGGQLLEKLRNVSQRHDEVLDPLGPWTQGIPMRFDRRSRWPRPF